MVGDRHMLTIQIAVGVAAGILLAYALIFHHRAVLSGTSKVLQSVAVIAALAAFVWVLSSIPQTVSAHSESISRFAGHLGMVVAVVLILALGAFGGQGFRTLVYRLRGKSMPPTKEGENSPLVRWSLLNFMLVAAFQFVSMALGIDGWMKAVDQFGRANGLADGLSMLLIAVLMLWPFLILGLLKLVRREPPFRRTTDLPVD